MKWEKSHPRREVRPRWLWVKVCIYFCLKLVIFYVWWQLLLHILLALRSCNWSVLPACSEFNQHESISDVNLFIVFIIGNFDEAIKLFTEAIFKNPLASMYAKRARYLTNIFCLLHKPVINFPELPCLIDLIFVICCCCGLWSSWPFCTLDCTASL